VEREDGYDGIAYADARELRQILRDHPEVTTLELNSDGGVPPAALEMAVAVTDFGLNTVVTERCESACTLVFLAGENRTLARGARLGFHSSSWGRDGMKEYYEETRESSGWLDEFAFASWAYEEGMRDFNKTLEFMVARGVDIQFIIRAAYVNFSDVWYPTDFEQIFGAVLIGVPYLIILWGFAPKWFEYKGSNSLVQSLWLISFIPMLPLKRPAQNLNRGGFPHA
jgi:hypothetical protein